MAGLASSLVDFLLGLAVMPARPDAGNRVALEGLGWGVSRDGTPELAIRKLEASALRLVWGPFTLEIGQLALHALVAQVGVEGGQPRLRAMQAASAEFSGVKVHGPVPQAAAAGAWTLGPLAAADGTIQAEIVDAHLLFDADVTVPIRQGQIDFGKATVEHVGPDSRMGVSRMGLYVDAANGRSYLYQFTSTPVAGVEFERRGAMLGPWVTDRGSLQLQAFIEGLLRQPPAAQFMGFTEQARLLFERTAVSGDVQLGDGPFAAPGVQAEVVGRAEKRNVVRLHSPAVGRGVTAEVASLLVRKAVLDASGMQLQCDEIAGALVLRLSVEEKKLRFAFEIGQLKMSGLRLAGPAPAAVRAAQGVPMSTPENLAAALETATQDAARVPPAR